MGVTNLDALTLGGALTVGGAVASTGVVDATAAGVRTKQSVANVNDTTPTDAELDSAFGTPASLGRGFIGTIDDNDGNTVSYIVWTTDAGWFWVIGTKAT